MVKSMHQYPLPGRGVPLNTPKDLSIGRMNGPSIIETSKSDTITQKALDSMRESKYSQVMTEAELLKLYDELGVLITSGPIAKEQLTEAQQYFARSFNASCIGEFCLTSYSELIDQEPTVSLRNLHAFIMGHCMGQKYNNQFDITTTTH